MSGPRENATQSDDLDSSDNIYIQNVNNERKWEKDLAHLFSLYTACFGKKAKYSLQNLKRVIDIIQAIPNVNRRFDSYGNRMSQFPLHISEDESERMTRLHLFHAILDRAPHLITTKNKQFSHSELKTTVENELRRMEREGELSRCYYASTFPKNELSNTEAKLPSRFCEGIFEKKDRLRMLEEILKAKSQLATSSTGRVCPSTRRNE